MDGPHASTQRRIITFAVSPVLSLRSHSLTFLSFSFLPKSPLTEWRCVGGRTGSRRAVALERLDRRAAALGEIPGKLRPRRAAWLVSRRPRGAPRRAAAWESGSAGEPPPSGTPPESHGGVSLACGRCRGERRSNRAPRRSAIAAPGEDDFFLNFSVFLLFQKFM
jgi:hypothetical protein